MSNTDLVMLMTEAEESLNEIEAWARQTEMDAVLDPLHAGDYSHLRDKIADIRNLIIRASACLGNRIND